MKLKSLKYLLISVLMWSVTHQSIAQNGGNTAFHDGEYLKFRIHYGVLNAGVATLKLTSTKRLDNRCSQDVF